MAKVQPAKPAKRAQKKGTNNQWRGLGKNIQARLAQLVLHDADEEVEFAGRQVFDDTVQWKTRIPEEQKKVNAS